jgi:hypothetical protein
MNFSRYPLDKLHPPQRVVEENGYVRALTNNSMGRVIFIASLVVLALIPLNLLQYKLLGWSGLPPL